MRHPQQRSSFFIFLIIFAAIQLPPLDSSSETLSDEMTGQGQRLSQQAEELLNEGDVQEALETFQEALAAFRHVRDRRNGAEMLVQIGYIQGISGQYRQALEFFKQALTIFKDLKDLENEAGTLTYIGIVHTWYNRYEEALKVYTQGLTLSKSIGDDLVAGRTLNRLGETYEKLGRFDEALASYQQARRYASDAQDTISEGANLAGIGNVLVALGQYTQAFEVYGEALPILQQAEDFQSAANIHFNSGSIYVRLGEHQKALEYFTKARGMFQKIHNQRGEADALTGIGLVYDDTCRENSAYCLKALASYQEALRIREKTANLGGQASTLHNIGGAYDRLALWNKSPAYYTQALQFYRKALAIRRKIGERTAQAQTLNNIGEVCIRLSAYENRGEYLEQALTALREALEIYRTIGERSRKWRALSNIGRVYELQGKAQEALEMDKQAIDALETIIADAGGIDEFKVSLGAQAAETYERAILLLMQANEPEQAFEFSERARARVLLDRLGNVRLRARDKADEALLQQERSLGRELAELERRLGAQLANAQPEQDIELIQFLQTQRDRQRKEYENLLLKLRLGNPEYLSLRRVAPPDLKKLQQLLDRKTTLLSYFVTPEKTLAFIITQDAFRAVELAVGENQLKTAISKARKPGRPNEPPPDALAALYAWLIAPLKSHLTTPSIGLIPHNALHYLPFAGLTDGQHYLGEEYILFSLPSASLLEFAQKKHKSDNGRILAMAYSEAKNSPLYYANREVEALAKLRETHMLSGKDATEAAFKRLSPDFSIIHLAAHGKLEAANPLFSRIFLAADEENDGALEVHEVYDLDLPQTDLVVLSACESDLGKRSRGDDIIGLTRAFMYAGTSSVIASLWKVNDRATQELMTVFYKQLKRGKSKAEALQVAQAKIRKKYRHPYYWAGFVLSGDPGASKQQSPWLAIVVIGTIIGGILVVILRNYYGKDAPPA